MATKVSGAARYRVALVREGGCRSVSLSGPAAVAKWAWETWFHDRDRESFMAVYLDSKNRLIGWEVVSEGALNASIVHPREVFKGAILASAAAVVVIHNHPSEDPAPSQEDHLVTVALADAGRLLDIPLHDHVIVAGAKKWYSFKETGLV